MAQSKVNERTRTRLRRKVRFKKKLSEHRNTKPRLVVYRSNRFLYAQVIDDSKGITLTQANTKEKNFEGLSSKSNIEAAKTLGKTLGERLLKLDSKVENVVFDRNGYIYHGRIQAVATGAREAGLKF